MTLDSCIQAVDEYKPNAFSNETKAQWLNEVRVLFPQETAEILQRHALDRYQLTELLTDREILEKMEPNQALLETVLSLKHMMKGPVLDAARRVVARVVAQLRRGAARRTEAFRLGPFAFDFQKMDFRRDGTPIELSKTEQRLLRVLVENRGRAVPRSVLVDRVWTDGAEFVEENALSVTVRRLRGKLEADPAKPEYLKTVYGIGYTWAVTP